MFCTNCGEKYNEDASFCDNCGVTIQPSTTAGGMTAEPAAAGNAATLKIGGTVLSDDLIFKGLAISMVVVLIFLPFLVHGFEIAGYSNQVSRHFFRHIFGSVGTIFSIFVLLIPAALFCLFQFKDQIQMDDRSRYILTIVLSVVGFIMPLVVRARIFRPLRAASALPFMNVSYWINPAIGFVLTLLLHIAVVAFAVIFLLAIGKSNVRI